VDRKLELEKLHSELLLLEKRLKESEECVQSIPVELTTAEGQLTSERLHETDLSLHMIRLILHLAKQTI
jgi:CII-binding regulator of phage lambda lysogenization HflD